MTVRSVIAKVLDKRHHKVMLLDKVHNGLTELEMHLENLQQMIDEQTIPTDLNEVAQQITQQMGSLRQETLELDEAVTHVTKRFNKETINIGVAGKARQGKSTLLQKISGLSNQEIPTSDELPCTGTKSKIFHTEENPHAKVEFYAKEEFLKEILHPYFDKLNLPKPFSGC